MDERDQLTGLLDKLTSDQVRLLVRFAAIIAEEQKVDSMHDTGDIRVRYERFKKWCDANNIDLAGVEAWAQESRRAAPRSMTAAS